MQLISVELLMSEQQKNDVLLSEEATSEGQTSASVQTEQAPAQITPPGAQLASYRKLKSLSVEDVASYLKLAPRQVHAIEADDYAALPGMAITRGFIRTYAKLLAIDPAPLLDALPKQEMRLGAVAGSDRVQKSTFNESSLPLRDRNKILPLAIAVAVAAAIAAGGFYFLHHSEDGPVSPLTWLEPKDDADAAATEDAVAPVVAASTDAAAVAAQATAAGSEQGSSAFPKFERLPVASIPGVSSAPAVTPAPVPTPAAVPTVAAPVVAPAVAPKAAEPAAKEETVKPVLNVSNSKDLLRLVLREDAWVELRRADDSVIFSRLLQAGSTESFDVPEPVQLIVGNASGVVATLRGSPLDLPVSKNNVARISLK
jgi:cytoskeleton protein RodZ